MASAFRPLTLAQSFQGLTQNPESKEEKNTPFGFGFGFFKEIISLFNTKDALGYLRR